MDFKDPEVRRAYNAAYYRRNKAQALLRSKRAFHATRDWQRNLKNGKACIECGENDVRCLDWHHTDPATKELNLGDLGRWGKAKVLAEIEKCIILCANCHRKHHAN